MDSWRDRLWYRFNFCVFWPVATLGFSFRSEGSQHMPLSGPVLLLANHESFLDPPLIGLAVRRQLFYLARKTLFRPPIIAAYFRSLGGIPLDQEGVAKEGLRASIDLLRAGKALLVFPEGERTLTGQMLPFKPGIQLLLRKAPVAIVPVGVAGAFEAMPLPAWLPRLSPLFWSPTGASVAVSVGKPIPPERYQALGRDGLLDYLFHEVQAQVRHAEKLTRKLTRPAPGRSAFDVLACGWAGSTLSSLSTSLCGPGPAPGSHPLAASGGS
jgi:1-acyl-sn-glycerol-3-phosphate acyltransferase